MNRKRNAARPWNAAGTAPACSPRSFVKGAVARVKASALAIMIATTAIRDRLDASFKSWCSTMPLMAPSFRGATGATSGASTQHGVVDHAEHAPGVRPIHERLHGSNQEAPQRQPSKAGEDLLEDPTGMER